MKSLQELKSQLQRKRRRSFSGKDKWDNIEVLISKLLIDSYISHDEFVAVNDALREYNEMKKEIRNPETSVEYTI